MVSLSACRRLAQVGLVLLAGLARGDSDDYTATTASEADVPQTDDTLVLTLSVTPGEFSVVPLTDTFGLNESGRDRRNVTIVGNIRTADDSNYNEITGRSDVAYLSCDEPESDTNIDPNKILNELMQAAPEAIILYSKSGNWCSLDYSDPIAFTNVLSMVDAGEALQVLDFLNGTNSGTIVQVSITGNTTHAHTKSSGSSSVAMSVLYSITGIISLLFIIIITTGAIRAHRYPERYGPRGAFGGRPRQSRAKGLARAVLETLPIVKFGNQQPRKPDPELELETATQRTASIVSENNHSDMATTGAKSQATPTLAADPPDVDNTATMIEEHLGCSICTEDFEVGEDVRVLPCSHQFHPTCIDPWLVNVSGTCPLCRLNLQPGLENRNGEPAEGDVLPPPLPLEGDDATAASHRHRLSRIFDIHRLRQATAEEQMDALRQMRAQQADAEPPAADREAGHQGAKFTAKLKEKFRIRTRAQPESQD